MPVSVLNVSKPWKKNELTRWLIFFSIAIIFTALDLITKHLTYKINTIDIIPGVLEFKFISNKGIIWGLFSQGSLLFIVISALAIPLIIFMFKYIYVFAGHETKQEDNVQPLTPVNNDDRPLDMARETPAPPVPGSRSENPSGLVELEAISKFTPLERTQPEDKDDDSHPERSEGSQKDSSLPLQNDCGQLSNEAGTNTNEVISNIVPTNSCRDNGAEYPRLVSAEAERGKNLLLPEMPIRKFSIFSIIGILTIACGLILAGAIGNLYDRIFYQGVRDFISFYIINWPIFNLADVFITIGALLIIFCMFKKPHATKTNSMDDTHGA